MQLLGVTRFRQFSQSGEDHAWEDEGSHYSGMVEHTGPQPEFIFVSIVEAAGITIIKFPLGIVH